MDTNGVYGAPRFYKAAKAAGIRALVGAEVTLREERHPEERSDEGSLLKPHPDAKGIPRSARNDKAGAGTAAAPPRLTLLVENRTGYRNLCRLITAGALGKPKGEPRR